MVFCYSSLSELMNTTEGDMTVALHPLTPPSLPLALGRLC